MKFGYVYYVFFVEIYDRWYFFWLNCGLVWLVRLKRCVMVDVVILDGLGNSVEVVGFKVEYVYLDLLCDILENGVE